MRAVSSDFDLGADPITLRSYAAHTPHNETCANCGGPSSGNHCLDCTGQECAVCGFPVYRDESWSKDAHGLRHGRCAGGARARPAEMCRRGRTMQLERNRRRKA